MRERIAFDIWGPIKITVDKPARQLWGKPSHESLRRALIALRGSGVRTKVPQVEQPLARTERKRQLAMAAEALLPDYAAGGELTIFTALDSESFYA